MGAEALENGFWPAAMTADLRLGTQGMNATAHTGDESTGTTRDALRAPTDDQDQDQDLPAAIDGPYVPRSIPGGTVIEATAYRCTDDEAALRYDGSTPTHVVGLCSETKVRNALRAEGYTSAEVDRALARGERLHDTATENAWDAVRVAEAGVATDGGRVETGAETEADGETCDECGLSLADAHEQPAGYVVHTLDGERLCGACADIRYDRYRGDRETADELTAVTDGGQIAEALPGNREVAESETATDHGGVWSDEYSRGCETCGDTESFERKAARLPDGMVADVCPTCYDNLPGRSETTSAGYAPSEVGR